MVDPSALSVPRPISPSAMRRGAAAPELLLPRITAAGPPARLMAPVAQHRQRAARFRVWASAEARGPRVAAGLAVKQPRHPPHGDLALLARCDVESRLARGPNRVRSSLACATALRACGWRRVCRRACLRSHGYVQVEDPDYMLTIADRVADALAASGTIGRELADALKGEAGAVSRRAPSSGTWRTRA